MKVSKFLRTPTVFSGTSAKGFVSPQNTIMNSSGEFGLGETLTERKVFFKRNNSMKSKAAI